ncbi:homoserine O-acetyltransferase [Mucor mucedo]|uniref:homoserine O-acetyltransferase n=1 Tax=Mucor mucedo TaxID=29922 RepID=UPI00221ECAE1|nr:homoserine O-acetyltransferase [Mucor mucedo]KAI7896321.1 homoserine O-acetyltransferase [Mucor mucedo]
MQEYKTYATINELPSQESKNKLVKLIPDQNITIIPEYTLESGAKLTNIPIAWKSWGKLNEKADNCMVICHALTGSADVEDWWGPLMGPRRAFDYTKFFIVCCNVLGSPYGSASPLTINPETGNIYGPEFPLVSVRDDVGLHRLILNQLGVKQIAVCVGGSMGGMQVLEWAQMGQEYVRAIVPIATSGRHSAWGISWGEAQRQSIYSDPNYADGYYTDDKPPVVGLSAARMSALLTYRSRDSFESRFGRKASDLKSTTKRANSSGEANRLIHNDGHRATSPPETRDESTATINTTMPTPFVFSAQSYLRYQGSKFISRFDANCYIALTRKMDSHDVSRGRGDYFDLLASISQPALVIGIESDGLFTISEQYELAEGMADTEMIVIDSPDGHDGFLLEFDQINRHILNFIKRVVPEIYSSSTISDEEASEVVKATKTSLFGEAEVDITQW